MKEELQLYEVAEDTPVYYTYKDRVFRMLFRDKKRLLELYNALNNTHYQNEDDLIINTLENAIFMKMKNDISFIVDCNMCLYEHQSTYCPNMPLRGFFYFADLYKKITKNADLCVSKRILLPTPHYIVFYNEKNCKEEELVQKLSESFEDESDGCMELTVRVININYGHNKELMEKCRPLYEYAVFVEEVRDNLETMELNAAVEKAVDDCINKDILKEFLIEQKSEVIAMSIYEYNEEYVRKSLYENGYEQGEKSGDALRLIKSVDAIMKNLNINLEKACEMIGTTYEEYCEAKKKL